MRRRRHAISEQTIYTWRKRFGELRLADVRRLRQLEAENARLKKLVAERDLEIEVMKEVRIPTKSAGDSGPKSAIFCEALCDDVAFRMSLRRGL